MESDIQPLLPPPPGSLPEDSAPLRQVCSRGLFGATLAAVMGPLSFGFVLGFSSPAIGDLQRSEDLVLDKEMASWFGSIVTIGAAAGGLAGGRLVDLIGRKLSLILCAIPFVGGFMLIICAQSVWVLLAGRLLSGVASGVTSLVVPVYIAETAHSGVRGMLGSCVQLMVVTGILGAYLAGMFLEWRWLAVLGSVPPVVMAISMIFMPETPRFLVSQRQRAAALSALRFLRGPAADAEGEYREIQSSIHQQEAGCKMADFRSPAIYKPFLVGVALMFLQQFSGINAIMFYADMIFKEANFQNSGLASVIVGVIQVGGTALAALIMDKAGRKVLLIVSGGVMSVSAALFGVYFRVTDTPAHNSSSVVPAVMGSGGGQLSWLPLVSMSFFIAGFAIGWGPIPWLLMSEIFPLRVRGVASGVCVVTNWGCAFLVTKEFHDMMDSLTCSGTFWLFGGFCALGVLFTALSVPETKGKTLEEIEAHFRGLRSEATSGSVQ